MSARNSFAPRLVLLSALALCPLFVHADDAAQTLRTLQEASERGDVQAMLALARLYQAPGAAHDGLKAVNLLRQAVAKGSADAASLLGQAYNQGLGIPRNHDEAVFWFRRADAGDGASANPGAVIDSSVQESLAITNSPRAVAATYCAHQPKPEMPKIALQSGRSGTVKAEALIVNGRVRDVTIYSGPTIYHDAVRKAMMKYQCSGVGAIAGTQEFNFKLDGITTYRIQEKNGNAMAANTRFDAAWKELSNAEQRAVRAAYTNLPPQDEPPYPMEGMGALLENIRLMGEHFKVKGEFFLVVKVDATGKAEAIGIEKSPDGDFSRYVAAVAVHAKYKPAMCAGSPCAMDFPIEGVIVRSD